MQPRLLIALGIGGALFALSLATFRWNAGGLCGLGCHWVDWGLLVLSLER